MLNNLIEERPMFQILAMLPPPIMLLILAFIILAALLIIPKLRRSKTVDKLNEGLFGSTAKDTVDEAIDNIKTSKEALTSKSKENIRKIADVIKEQSKIERASKK